jgi:hypothetical protein
VLIEIPPRYRVLTATDSTTCTNTLDVDVNAGSAPDAPPPRQVTCQVIVARRVYLPPEADREAVVYV